MRKSKTIRKSRKNRTTKRCNRSTMRRSGGGFWESIKNAFSSTDTPVDPPVINNETFIPLPNETTNPEAVVTGGRKKRRNKVRN